jgi:hypothetical protein
MSKKGPFGGILGAFWINLHGQATTKNFSSRLDFKINLPEKANEYYKN